MLPGQGLRGLEGQGEEAGRGKELLDSQPDNGAYSASSRDSQQQLSWKEKVMMT